MIGGFNNMKKTENLQVCSSRTTEIAEIINRKVSYCINQTESEISVGNNISSLSGRNSVNALLLGDYQDELKVTLEKTTGLPVTLLKFSKGMGHYKEKLNSNEQLNLFRTEFLEAIKRKGIVLCTDLDMIEFQFVCDYLVPALDMCQDPSTEVHRNPLCTLVATSNSDDSGHMHTVQARFNCILVL